MKYIFLISIYNRLQTQSPENVGKSVSAIRAATYGCAGCGLYNPHNYRQHLVLQSFMRICAVIFHTCRSKLTEEEEYVKKSYEIL